MWTYIAKKNTINVDYINVTFKQKKKPDKDITKINLCCYIHHANKSERS